MSRSAWDTQEGYDLRLEWGEPGIRRLSSVSAVAIVVDVLSFSTAVSIAVERGATVFPYQYRDATAVEYARTVSAALANSDRGSGYSLSPASLLRIPPGTRLVLPSPNGSSLSLLSKATLTLTGCLRNAAAVAKVARQFGQTISVIPAGERWPDGGLRAAVEDYLGAGAILSHLRGAKSPEALAAESAFRDVLSRGIRATLQECMSGRELIERGFAEDVELAAELDVCDVVPVLREQAFVSNEIRQ
jgi:2-phosphosulfolactate phosphatase